MAPSPLANDPGERYAELERAYTEDRWPDVVEQGGQLIADLGNTPDPLTMDLANRAQLLVGHAHLYGLRNPAAALPHYQAVLAGPADPDLRRIAEDALPHCQPPVEPKAAAAKETAAGAAALESGSDNSAAEAFATSAPIEAAASPAVAQERGPWATLETTAEPLDDQPLDTEAAWTPRPGTAEQAITEAATPWLQRQPLSMELEQPIQTEVGGELAATLPLQPPAGFGPYDGGVIFGVQWTASLPWPDIAATALAVHLLALAVTISSATLARALGWSQKPLHRLDGAPATFSQ
jgi:hypothetical protein